ncbi:Hypothetical protein KLENKIAIHU_4382, partial [Klenkia terrae]
VDLQDVLSQTRDAITVRRVFADPVQVDGVTVITAAAVGGGGGGGGGHAEDQEGQGAGFGVGARPAGAYVISGGTVSWRPAVDVNRLVGVAGLVLVTLFLTRARVARPRVSVRRSRRG